MSPKPDFAHPKLDAFPIQDGSLLVGDIPLPRLAAQVGSTPFYAYDRRLIAARVAHLRHHLPDDIALHYAIKANPMPAVVGHLAGLVDGFDVASGGELNLALDTGMAHERVGFAGPGKIEAELAQAIAAGVTIELESESELRTVARLGAAMDMRPRVAARVNPDFTVKGSGMRMGGGAQQFGVDSERVPDILRELAALDIDFVGLHIFGGSQNLLADTIVATQAQTVELALAIAQASPLPVRYVNIGGGFGIPYFPADKALDLAPIGENLATLRRRIAERLPEARVVVELGRYLVGEAGIYVSRIVDRKESRGKTFLVTDGGLHHHLAASGNFGQVVRRNYPVIIGNRAGEPATEEASVVGNLCTPLDLLADKVALPRAEIGDLVVIFQSGAYGLTASPVNFLGDPAPVEVLA